MDFFDNPYYRLNMKLLTMTGQWPYQKPMDMILRRICVTAVIATGAYLLINSFILSDSWGAVAGIFPFGVVDGLVVVKYVIHCITFEKIRDLLEFIKADCSSVKTKQESFIIESTAEYGRVYVLRYVVTIYTITLLGVISLNAGMLVQTIRRANSSEPYYFPFSAKVIVHQDDYIHILASTIGFILFTGVTVILGRDGLYISSAQHARGMFRIASHKFTHSCDELEINLKDDAYKKIVSGVESHRRAIMFTAKLAACYRWDNFISALVCMASISLSLLCVVLSTTNWMALMVSVWIACGQIFYIFLILNISQKVVDDSSTVFGNVYGSQWFMAPAVVQKLMLVIMQRSSVPSVIDAGHMIPLSIGTFSTIMQTCLSYFMALCSLR